MDFLRRGALAFFPFADITYFPFLESFFFTLIYASDSFFVSFFRSLPPFASFREEVRLVLPTEMTQNEFV
jgi:hypothetical protein